MRDVKNIIKSTGVALEAEAFKQFGAAVQGVADRALSGIFKSTGATELTGDSDAVSAADAIAQITPLVWDSTRYAAQNVSTGRNSTASNIPRTKFLFKVSFIFNSGIAEYASTLGGKTVDELMRGLDYSVKQIDLPSVSFDYEMVNMYNFRTKVLKSITHDEISFTFYDDVSNKSLDFANLYRMLHVPISRREHEASTNLGDYGFSFSNSPNELDSSNRGALYGGNNNVLAKIIIHQYYMEMGSHDPVKVNDFVFTNPRISKLSLGDHDHEDTNFNLITGTFDFDTLYIETGLSAAKDSSTARQHRSPSAPMIIDILSGYNEGSAYIVRGAKTSPGNERNPFVDILARQGERAVQSAISGALRKVVGNNAVGRALNGAIGSVSGSLGAAANRTINSIGTGVVQGFALPTKPAITDNAAPVTDLSVPYDNGA
jgi:hypothetical protein